MANDKYIIGLFDHEDKLVSAIRAFKKKGIEITQTLTPFPVHGLENELEYEGSRLHTAGFLFGMTGMTLALFLMTWVSVSNYPLNVGGKPFFALPAFIPVTFELTVLFAAVGMVMVYLKRNQLFPGNIPRIYDDRITDDRFALVFEVNDETTQADFDAITGLLKESEVTEIKTKEFEEGAEMFTSIEREFVFENSNIMAQPLVEEVSTTIVEEEIKEVLEIEKAPVEEVVKAAPVEEVTTPIVEPVKAAIVEEVVEPKEEKTEEELKDQLFEEIGTATEADKDELKRIKGIGKVYEGRLNNIGIFTFAQISNLKGKGVEAIEALTGFPGRIHREDWIGQAKIFRDGGETDFSKKVDKGNMY